MVGVSVVGIGTTGAWVVEVVTVPKGTVVSVGEGATVVAVVVVLLGLVGLVDVVEEDVVDVDAITPKSMSLRCSPSSRWTMYVRVCPSSWASPCPKATTRDMDTARIANTMTSHFMPPDYQPSLGAGALSRPNARRTRTLLSVSAHALGSSRRTGQG